MADTLVTPELIECTHGCGKTGLKGVQGDVMHYRQWCPENPDLVANEGKRRKAFEESMDIKDSWSPDVQSKRGFERRGFTTHVATPMEQVRPRPGGLTDGPAAYYLNPRGATIAEALIIYPNGAPMIRRGREIGNAVYVQNRQRERGYEYIGPTLTPEGARRLVEIIQSNRSDFLLDLKEQVADCEHDVENSDRPDVRDNQKKRKMQLMRLVAQVQTPLDGEALVNELDQIVQAHKLAAVPPAMREAITAIAGEAASAHVLAMVNRLEGGKTVSGDSGTVVVTNATADDDF